MDISFSAPKKTAVKVPPGHVLVNKRWMGSPLGKELTKPNMVFSDCLGFIDFFPSESCPVIYITEGEMVIGSSHSTERVKMLSREYGSRGIVLADHTGQFKEIQALSSIQLDLTSIPITKQSEIPPLLTSLSHVEGKLPSNPFKSSSNSNVEANMEAEQIALLKLIPNIGEVNALKLLKSYGHISAIANLSEERLFSKLGGPLAKTVYNFFRSNVNFKM